ncbi:MAG: pyridoxal phosphate-dependent aminotransferase [Planctomycetes bacterium]|nr:pyridoxal phosphate-dependent aminotransferase [Planctomycetota bacterium]
MIKSSTNFLRHVPPMGIYETLYSFQGAFGSAMGEAGTHPWSQGYPRTVPLPDGPEIPSSVSITSDDLKYPKSWGLPALRVAIARSYRDSYGVDVEADNVMVFAGGRPGLIALLLFMHSDIRVRISETEYTPYYDMLRTLNRNYSIVPSNTANGFRPSVADFMGDQCEGRRLVLLSNPCNPTGHTRNGDELKELVDAAAYGETGLLVDEAYEFFHEKPETALIHVDNLNESNLFVCGAATKGLQAPGLRIGWVVAAKKNIEILGNFGSFGMGGVSHPSQKLAVELLEPARLKRARRAVSDFYAYQRNRYGAAFQELGLKLHSGDGGFYHWCELPENVTSSALNEELFKHGAAILKGTDCDMERRGNESPLRSFFRFSFGPLDPNSFDDDIRLLRAALQSCTQ